MASNVKISTTCRNNMVDEVGALLDGGTGAGTIAIRTGAPPSTPATASSGTLLATCTFNATSFGAGSSGTATANAITSDTNADASGDAGYFRCYPGAAADTGCVFQGTAGDSGDSPDMTFDNKSIVAGGTVAISSFTITQPEQ